MDGNQESIDIDDVPCCSKDVTNAPDTLPPDENQSLEIMESVEMDRLLDQKLEEAATRRNLSVFNVKRLLKEVLTDQDVVQMFRSYLKGDDVVREGIGYEPRITRSSTRLAENTGHLPGLFGSQALGVVSMPPPPRILDLEFPDEGEDEDMDYEPTQEDEDLEEKDLELDADQEVSTELINYPPLASPAAPTPPETPEDSLQVVDPPALRTRSRLPVVSDLESVEATWQPPDVTPDMYGPLLPPDEMDEDYKSYVEFLHSLFTEPLPHLVEEVNLDMELDQPVRQSTPDPLMMQEGDEDDPEFNLMLEPEEAYHEDLLEDIRDDRAVKVPKWEIKELFDDLYGLFPSDEEPDATLSSSIEPNTSHHTSDHEDTSSDIFNRPPVVKFLMPSSPTPNTEDNLEVNDLINLQTNVIPHFSLVQYEKLRCQVSMHIQLLASTYVTHKCNEPPLFMGSAPPSFSRVSAPVNEAMPGHTSIALQQRDYAEEIKRFKKKSEQFHQRKSIWSVDNLTPALDLMREFNGLNHRLKVVFTPKACLFKEIALPQCLIQIFLCSSAFPHPRLLPSRYIMYNHAGKLDAVNRPWLPVEDCLFALGCIQFGYHLKSAYELIHRYVLPIRSRNQLTLRKTNLSRRKDNIMPDNPMLKIVSEIRVGYMDLSQIQVTSWVNDLPQSQPFVPLWNHISMWHQLPPDYQLFILRKYPDSAAEANLPKQETLKKMRPLKQQKSPIKVEHRNFNSTNMVKWNNSDPTKKEILVDRCSKIDIIVKKVMESKPANKPVKNIFRDPVQLVKTEAGCFVKVPAAILLPLNISSVPVCSNQLQNSSIVVSQNGHEVKTENDNSVFPEIRNFLADNNWSNPFPQSSVGSQLMEIDQQTAQSNKFISFTIPECNEQLEFQQQVQSREPVSCTSNLVIGHSDHSQDLADLLAIFNTSKDEIDGIQVNDLQKQNVLEDVKILPTLVDDVQVLSTVIDEVQILPTVENEGILPTVQNDVHMVPTLQEENSIVSTVQNDFKIVPTVQNDFQIVPTVQNDFQIVSTVQNDFQIVPTVQNDFQIVPTVQDKVKISSTVQNDNLALPTEALNRSLPTLISRKRPSPFSPEAVAAKSIRRARRVLLARSRKASDSNIVEEEEMIVEPIEEVGESADDAGTDATEEVSSSCLPSDTGETSIPGRSYFPSTSLGSTQFYSSLTQLMLCSQQVQPSRLDILRGRRFRIKCQCQSLSTLVVDESIDPSEATLNDEADLAQARNFLNRMRYHLLSQSVTGANCADDSTYETALQAMSELSRQLQHGHTDDAAVFNLWTTLSPLLPDFLKEDLISLLQRRQVAQLDLLPKAIRIKLVNQFYRQLLCAVPTSTRYWARMRNLLRNEASDQLKVLQRCASGLRLNPLVQAHLVTLHLGHTPYSGFPGAFEEITALGHKESNLENTIPLLTTDEVDNTLAKSGPNSRLACPCHCHEHLRPRTKPKKVDSLGMRHCIRCSLRVYRGIAYIDECNFHLTNVAITWPAGFTPRSQLRRAADVPKGTKGRKLGQVGGRARRRAVRKESVSDLQDFLTTPNSTVDPAGMWINLENYRTTKASQDPPPFVAKEKKTAPRRATTNSPVNMDPTTTHLPYPAFAIDEDTCFYTESFAPPPLTPPPVEVEEEDGGWTEAEDRCILEHCQSRFCSVTYCSVPWEKTGLAPRSPGQVKSRVKYLMKVYLTSVGEEYFSEDFDDDPDDET